MGLIGIMPFARARYSQKRAGGGGLQPEGERPIETDQRLGGVNANRISLLLDNFRKTIFGDQIPNALSQLCITVVGGKKGWEGLR